MPRKVPRWAWRHAGLDALDALVATLPGQHYLYPLDVTNASALASAANDFIGDVSARPISSSPMPASRSAP